MIDLKTVFAGLELANPIIVSSSGLTDNVEKIVKLQEYGAGAVVLKSIFEEQILYEGDKLLETADYPEAEDYIRHYTRNNSLDTYLILLESAKKAVSIPVIASVNCVSASGWTDFAGQIAGAGADALELNVYYMPVNMDYSSQDYEQVYFDLLTEIKKRVRIPVILKLGAHFTHPVKFIEQLYNRGADGAVLFNRFYSPDINIDELRMTSAEVLSSPADIRVSLRWIAIISSLMKEMPLAASTGVHSGAAVVKQLLAGARAVQVCSVLYREGPAYLALMKKELEEWMSARGFEDLSRVIGMMNYASIGDPAVYERSQFMRYFSGMH
jgi:dihydroorotate dehydrogenase (fumarate)